MRTRPCHCRDCRTQPCPRLGAAQGCGPSTAGTPVSNGCDAPADTFCMKGACLRTLGLAIVVLALCTAAGASRGGDCGDWAKPKVITGKRRSPCCTSVGLTPLHTLQAHHGCHWHTWLRSQTQRPPAMLLQSRSWRYVSRETLSPACMQPQQEPPCHAGSDTCSLWVCSRARYSRCTTS